MKCVNAVWDFRNLGVKTVKFEIEKNDILTDCLDKIEEFRMQHDAIYVVVKANVRYIDASIFFQKAGFLLLENEIFTMSTRKGVLKVLEEYKNFCDDVSYKLADENEIQMILSEIEKGIFKISDYVAVDPYFSTETKNRRFILYVKDMIAQGSEVFLTYYQKNPIGFFIRKVVGNKKSEDKLSGTFSQAEANHQGAFSNIARCKHFIDDGILIETSAFSASNLNVFRMIPAFNVKITGAKNVFVKHYD